MRASNFTDLRKATIIRQGEHRVLLAGICCKVGISKATHVDGKKRAAGGQGGMVA